jgi:acetyltransferase-like isoleucine patch superfamily enzyme
MINSLSSIAGAVHIGKNTFMGMSSAVKEGVSIGAWSIIGMGSVVCNDIPEETVAAGNPARPMRRNEEKRVFKHR